ncbi:MAG TPA: PilZ domain-containing protein [Bryobacteraceae bacterium]|nr:PilZ domain-containing protein [Bryobacteraceae bacterium]
MSTDKRAITRQQVNASAMVQILGNSEAEHGRPFRGIVVDASPKGMGIRLPQAVEANRAIKVEIEDMMFLGEVAYCAPAKDHAGEYMIGIEIEQCLTGLSGLQHLVQALAEEKRTPVRHE